MATYKVIQDIEAEDHILGPLTLRQFIFALIAVLFFYLSFLVLSKGAAFLLVLFLPPGLFFGFFAVPFGRDQPTEVWALAKLRFLLKPRKRIWDQSGIKELVTITVPKKIEQVLTDGLSQYEVNSRLNVLATTLDSRGWAIKNASLSTAIPVVVGGVLDSDRLIDINSMPQTPEETVPDTADILDEMSNPLAQHLDQMISSSTQARRQQLVDKLNMDEPPSNPISGPPNNQWFMPSVDPPPNSAVDDNTVYAPDVESRKETLEDAAAISKIKAFHQAQGLSSTNLRTLQPMNQRSSAELPIVQNVNIDPPKEGTALTKGASPAIISELSKRNDLTIQTLDNEAHRSSSNDSPDEVVIPISH